ncbi:PIN domain nuclease [Actinoplanes subglobosus]|uniref:Ribonuclease VapC n=1 Tax=Actinoplanes subglobosus TaxID=1547892 RepID=A0ABV8J6W6_9ACTN
MSATYLVDTSAFMRLSAQPQLQKAWNDQMAAGRLALCPLTELEILYTAQSMEHRRQLQETFAAFYVWVPISDRAIDRAADVQEDMTKQGMQRSAGAIDLLVAATAEEHRMTVLHYDRDFANVARVTGQSVEWIAEPGTVN